MPKLRVQHPHPPHHALTLEQYRALDLTRPLTDPPLGTTTAARRSVDANASAAIPVTRSAVPRTTPRAGGRR